jgi:hypothetical protein
VIGHGSSRRSDNPRRNVAQPAMDDVSPIRAKADRTRWSRGSDNPPYTHCPKGLTPIPSGTPTAGWRRLNRPTAPLGGRPGRISWSTRTPGWGRTHRTTAARTAYAPGQRRIGRFGAHPGAPPQSTSNEPQASPWRTLADLRCLAISSDTASATHRTVAHRADRSLGAAETPLRGNSEWPMVNPDECQTTRSEHPYGAGH